MSLARSLLLALAGCACFASNAAAQTVKLRAAFDPDVAGQRTTIELSLRIVDPKGATPVPVTSLDLSLPAGTGIATTTLGQANCDAAHLLDLGLQGCSANARVGYGSATAVVPVGSQSVRENASLDVLMGPPAENRVEVLFYLQAREPVFAQLVLPSVVEEAGPPYGEELATSVPLVQAWPEGPDLALETFNSTIGPSNLVYHRQVNGKTVVYHPHGVRIPRVCPPGGFPFGALLSFQDGSHSNTVYRVPCPPR
jgi:hypothetical protein